jgi:hypothetical protein
LTEDASPAADQGHQNEEELAFGGAHHSSSSSDHSSADPVTSGRNGNVRQYGGLNPAAGMAPNGQFSGDVFGITIACDAENQTMNLSWHQPTSGLGEDGRRADHFYVYLLDNFGKTYKEFVVSAQKGHTEDYQVRL